MAGIVAGRHGFTLVEMLVALSIMIVLGALVVPSIIATVDRSRAEAAEESLEAIADAVELFADRVDEYPATLDQLVIPVTGADSPICGGSYTGGEQNRWAGPYLDRALTATGVPIGVGTVQNAFTVLADPSGIDYLRVGVRDVLVEDARALDQRIDAADGASGGALRWSPATDPYVIAYYLIPFPDC